MLKKRLLVLFLMLGLSSVALGGRAVYAATTNDAVTVSANVSFVVPASITLDQTAIGYGTIAEKPSSTYAGDAGTSTTGHAGGEITVADTPINVTYATNSPSWTIQAYVTNANGQPAIVSATKGVYVLQKIWCANFGAASNGKNYADPNNADGTENASVWVSSNSTAAWFYWGDSASNARKLAWFDSTKDASLPSGFATYVAGDFRSASTASDYTASLIYELVTE